MDQTLIDRWCLSTASQKQHNIILAPRMSNPLLKKNISQMGLSLQRLGLMSCCQVLWRSLVSCWVWCSFAAQSRADRWALPNSCWPPSIRSAAPMLLPPLPQPQHHSSYCEDAPLILCCTYRSEHECFLWVNRAYLQHSNEKGWETEPPIYCKTQPDDKSVFSHSFTWI